MMRDTTNDANSAYDADSSNQDMVLVAVPSTLAPGESIPHGSGTANRGFIERSYDAVSKDWQRVLNQMDRIANESASIGSEFRLDEISFELTFTVEGKLAFIANANAASSVTATFRRRVNEDKGLPSH
jgi:hypothetical protein